MNTFYWSVGVSYSHLVLGWLRTGDVDLLLQLNASLRLLQFYAEISELKINLEKNKCDLDR
jgi:hypothetical protein